METAEKQRKLSPEKKLPPEIWEEIGKRLLCRLDVVRFRSVCKRWRSSLACPSRFPLRVPSPLGASENKFQDLPLFITEHSYYDADQGWAAADQPNRMLMVLSEVDRGGKFHPRAVLPTEKHNEFSVTRSYMDPPIPNLSRLSFLSKAYDLRVLRLRLHRREGGGFERQWCLFPQNPKIAVLCSDPTTTNFNFARDCDLTVAALLSGGKLALLRLGHLPLIWETPFCPSRFKDIITYNGQLFTIDNLGRTFVMDYHSLHMTQVAVPLETESSSSSSSKDMVFVEALGHLYLLVSESLPKDCFLLDFTLIDFNLKVYRLRSNLHQWVQVEDLGDQVFFLHESHRFSAPRDLFADIGLIDLKYNVPHPVAYPHLLFSHPSPDAHTCARYLTVPIASKPCVSLWFPVQPSAANTNSSLLAQLADITFSFSPRSFFM